MTDAFSTSTIKQLARRLREPEWVTTLRHEALARHAALAWPHKSDDIWRRTDVSLLDPMRGFSPVGEMLLRAVPLGESQFASLAQPLGNEQLLVRANGSWVTDARAHGLTVEDLTQAACTQPDSIRRILEADGMSLAEQKLTSLNAAFHHDDLVVQVPPHCVASRPVRLVHLFAVSPKSAIFPTTIVTVGAGSVVTLVDEYVSVDVSSEEAPHLINARIELVLEPDAVVHYVRLQRWDRRAREFLLQRATLAKGSTLTMANITLGAALSKAHVSTRLSGERASTRLYGFVFGRGAQHIDQHTLQDHTAPHTTSDLQFKAALQDRSRMIYTGLIRIAKPAAQTEAFQANHNLMLSQTARAETIPMLEILADDVQCKHAASIGPIDDEQAFYLMSRGVPHKLAQRLIVMGFVEPIVQQIPFGPLRDRLRLEIEEGLHQ